MKNDNTFIIAQPRYLAQRPIHTPAEVAPSALQVSSSLKILAILTVMVGLATCTAAAVTTHQSLVTRTAGNDAIVTQLKV